MRASSSSSRACVHHAHVNSDQRNVRSTHAQRTCHALPFLQCVSTVAKYKPNAIASGQTLPDRVFFTDSGTIGRPAFCAASISAIFRWALLMSVSMSGVGLGDGVDMVCVMECCFASNCFHE